MNQIPEEECPICWRSFSSLLTPMTLVCGHSLCEECSEDLKKCPLCRRKITAQARSTNYSMVSLLEKLDRVEKKEFRDQTVQTERPTPRPRSASNRLPKGYTPVGPMLVPTVIGAIVKLTRIQQTLASMFKLNLNQPLPN